MVKVIETGRLIKATTRRRSRNIHSLFVNFFKQFFFHVWSHHDNELKIIQLVIVKKSLRKGSVSFKHLYLYPDVKSPFDISNTGANLHFRCNLIFFFSLYTLF